MPVIPTVLVNGSEGIGTGWSTYVPNYNPRDVIMNVRRMLNGEEMEPMHPWYRGFKGTIEKTASKEAGVTYTITGIVEEINETSLRVTELPVRRWTNEYKEFLEALSAKEQMDPLIKASPEAILAMMTDFSSFSFSFHDVFPVVIAGF